MKTTPTRQCEQHEQSSPERTEPPPADDSSYAAFTPASTFLLSSTLSSTLRIYNIHTSKVLKTLRAPTVFVSEKFPCPALLYPAIIAEDGMDIDTNGTDSHKAKTKGEAWVVSGSENGNVVIWELSTRRVAQVLDDGGHTTPVVAVAVSHIMRCTKARRSRAGADQQVSPDGRRLATGSLEPEKIIHLWHDSA